MSFVQSPFPTALAGLWRGICQPHEAVAGHERSFDTDHHIGNNLRAGFVLGA